MAIRTFRYRNNWDFTIDADLDWTSCRDGLCITRGTLPGNGFTWGHGITVPEEIDGIPVTELNVDWHGKLDYIDGPSLKRITLRLTQSPSLFSGNASSLTFGTIYGNSAEQLVLSSSVPLGIRIDSKPLKYLSVTAPDIHLLDEAFRNCPNLETVSFHGTVRALPDWEGTTFPDNLFRDCNQLTAVHGVFQGDYSGQSAFENCRFLTTGPSLRMKILGPGYFQNCESLRGIHLSDGMLRIHCYAFANCRSLEDLYIPDSVRQLGPSIFRDCRNLRSVHLPDVLTEIPDYAFYSCHALKKVFLSDNLVRIGTGAFADCPSLHDPWIPKNLHSIGARAFYGCRFTKPILIPPSVKELGAQAFGAGSDLCIRGIPGTEAEAFARRENIRFLPSKF